MAARVPQVHPPAAGSSAGPAPLRRAQSSAPKIRKSVSSRIHEAVKALALCHNVTPVYESRAGVTGETESAEADQDFSDENRTYQASSPDEVSSCLLEDHPVPALCGSVSWDAACVDAEFLSASSSAPSSWCLG